jgi:hypothetical protein
LTQSTSEALAQSTLNECFIDNNQVLIFATHDSKTKDGSQEIVVHRSCRRHYCDREQITPSIAMTPGQIFQITASDSDSNKSGQSEICTSHRRRAGISGTRSSASICRRISAIDRDDDEVLPITPPTLSSSEERISD